MRRRTLKQMVLLLTAGLALSALVAGACGKDEGGASPTTPGDSRALPGTMQGVTDTEVRIGTLLPLTGTAAAWGVGISRGMQAYFDYINDEGGMYGRQLKLYVGDSGYSGPVAAEAVRRLVEQDKVFMLQGNLGTEVESAVYQYLEERGIPDMYILTGASKFTVPVVRTRFSGLVDYATEGRILARYVFQNFDGKKLGIIAQNDDFGKEGEQGIKQGLKDEDAEMEIVTEYYDETQNDVTAQVQRLKNANVDVIGFYGMPLQAASLFKTARETLSWDVPVVITGTDAVEIVAGLAGYENIEGAVSVTIGHQAFETEYPGVAKHLEIMAEYAPDVKPDNLTLVGYAISEAMVNLLRQAGPDLTRDSFLDAAESVCKFVCSTCLVPTSTSPTDHRPTEVQVYVRATGTDADTFKWEPFGEPFGFESTEECVTPTPPPGFDQQPE
jgi:branched-chain amino acid transport system substrate-binding protein